MSSEEVCVGVWNFIKDKSDVPQLEWYRDQELLQCQKNLADGDPNKQNRILPHRFPRKTIQINGYVFKDGYQHGLVYSDCHFVGELVKPDAVAKLAFVDKFYVALSASSAGQDLYVTSKRNSVELRFYSPDADWYLETIVACLENLLASHSHYSLDVTAVIYTGDGGVIHIKTIKDLISYLMLRNSLYPKETQLN